MLALSLAAVGLLSLSACGSDDDRLVVCSRAGVLYDASRLTLFGPGERTEANIAYDAEITNARVRCEYDGTQVVSKISFDIQAAAGPAATSAKQSFRYFVAVTELNQRVLDKRYQVWDAELPAGQVVRVTREIPNIAFSYARLGRADLYEILVGFDLTQDQLAYNRSISPFDRPSLLNKVRRPTLPQ